MNTKFSEEEMTQLCQILKRHGTDCNTLVDILKLANSASSSDVGATYKHIRLLKEFGVISDKDILCHTCVNEVINLHAEMCEEYKKYIESKEKYYALPSPSEHYDYSKCNVAVWMVDSFKINQLEHTAAK